MGKLISSAVVALAILLPAGALADGLPAPAGPVVLTVAGDAVGNPNRPPFDPFEDAFAKYHDKTFARAAAFDRAMLESLDQHEVILAYKGWPRTFRFRGPWLRDVLAAAGAGGAAKVTAVALDGFATEIPRAQLESQDWMVAVKRDGRYLNLGQRGPLWIVYPPDGEKATADDEGRWPWAVFMVLVE